MFVAVPPHVCSGSSNGLNAVAMSNPHALVFLLEVTHPQQMVHILNFSAIDQFLCERAKKVANTMDPSVVQESSRTGRTVAGAPTNQRVLIPHWKSARVTTCCLPNPSCSQAVIDMCDIKNCQYLCFCALYSSGSCPWRRCVRA